MLLFLFSFLPVSLGREMKERDNVLWCPRPTPPANHPDSCRRVQTRRTLLRRRKNWNKEQGPYRPPVTLHVTYTPTTSMSSSRLRQSANIRLFSFSVHSITIYNLPYGISMRDYNRYIKIYVKKHIPTYSKNKKTNITTYVYKEHIICKYL